MNLNINNNGHEFMIKAERNKRNKRTKRIKRIKRTPNHFNMINAEMKKRNNREKNKELLFIKKNINILQDCVDSLNILLKIKNNKQILPNNLPSKLVLSNSIIKNKISDVDIRKIIQYFSVNDYDLFINRLLELPLEKMLKNNRFRSNIIDLLRKLPYDIFNHLLFSSLSDMNPDIDYNIFSDNCLLNYDNSIHFIEFQNLNLNKLPELFGAIRSSNNIYLHNNELNSLPDSFGFIEVGATLCLSGNNLTKLPESFQNINIKYDLFLDNNPNLDELPNSLPNSFQHIGGQIFIHETNISDDYISDKFSNISDKFENWFY